MGRRKKWKHSAGERPYTVAVYERTPGGTLYARVWDPTKRGGEGNWVRRSLKYRIRDEDGAFIEEAVERAKTYAIEQAAKLRKGQADLQQGRVALSKVLELYQKHRTPRKSESEQRQDERRVEMWKRVLGSDIDPHEIAMREWERFIDLRRSGVIDARGKRVAEKKKHRPVRARTVEIDCDWLRWVFNWASKWRTAQGYYLMKENPVRGFEAPTEKNPRRPVATEDRYQAIREKSDQVPMEVRWHGKVREQRSYLSEILDIVNGTGRRISAVCSLRYRDLKLTEGPYGAIRWPADTDKTGRETLVPIGPDVRRALDRALRERPGIGEAPLFPSPESPSKPIRYELASNWLRQGEKLAGVEAHKGSLWHAYRRKWATERKHFPVQDVAAAGGWKSTQTVQGIYQQADQETMLRVVLEPGELREAR